MSEQNAQFAKESMACQSLDNDEILNVRWATEDPNPESKVAEKRRLEDMGREAIQARMDPRIVDAVRAVRALEEGDTLDGQGEVLDDIEVEELQDGEPEAKRRRLAAEDEQQTQPQLELPPSKPTGLLSEDTLESLKYFQEIRQRAGTAMTTPSKIAANPPSTGLGLGGYGSDDD